MRRTLFGVILGFLIVLFCLSYCNAVNTPKKIRKDFHPRPKDWYPKDHIEALKRTKKRYTFVEKVYREDPTLRELRLRSLGIGLKDITHSYMVLESPYVNTYEDKYGPVRFMHGAHAKFLDGRCAVCHHYKPEGASKEIFPCRACHQDAFNPDHPDRLGLKAAYHQRCIGCHKSMKKGPVDCNSCHRKKVPDHKKLVKLPKNPTPYDVTRECIRCHKNVGYEMLVSAHWLWRGPSTYTVNHRNCIRHGKGTDVLNNY